MMSRFPFGLLLSTIVLSSSCVSLMAPSTPALGLAQQQRVAKPVSTPGKDVAMSRSLRQRDYFETLLIDHSPKRPARIELGKPVPFSVSPEISKSHSQPQAVPVTEPARPAEVEARKPEQDWKLPLKSGTGRPVQMSDAGKGPFRIFVLGSIYGNEPESIELLDAVAQLSGTLSKSQEFTFLLMRTPNPDGLAEHIHTNHSGVDLNRNMPSTWFTAKPNRLTGPHPASEIETQNLITVLKAFQPDRVVHVRSSIGQRPLILVNEKLNHTVDSIRMKTKFDAGKFSGDYKVGSIEEFVTHRSGAELMAVHLPPKGFQDMKAEEFIQLITLKMEALPTTQPENNIANVSPQSEVLPFPEMQLAPKTVPQPDGEKGYVEFLPPPPNRKQANQTKQEIAGDPKYYELPPPPGR